MVMLIFNSCKKELYVSEKIDQEQLKKIHSYQNGAKLSTINFSQFKSKANLQSLGALKDIFLSPTAGKGKLMSINIPETYNGFAVQTDSIKVLNTNGHTSYIFPVKLSSPNAITFQNLTIDESAKGTVVFVNTYKPTQKWIDDWKKGKEGKFDGDISVTYLSGNNNVAGSSNKFSSNGKIASTNNNLSVIDANGCNVTTYYFELPYNCGSGQHGPYDSGCYLTGDDRAGIALINFEVTVCGPNNTVSGGGGSTSPNPPGEYNPCGGGSPTVTIIAANGARGDKLMVAENNPCDDEPLPTLPSDEPTEEADPDLKSDCNSWQYIPVGPDGDYQSCGVTGIDLDYITSYLGSDGNPHVAYIYYKFTVPIYFEFPHKRKDGSIVSSSQAAVISAQLRDEAEKLLEDRLGSRPNPGGTVMENAYLEILRGLLAPFGARVSRTPNYGTVPIKPFKKGFRGGGC